MLRMKKLLSINLRLFDGAASGGSAAPAAYSEGTPGAPADNKSASPGKKQGEKVVYGKQPEATNTGDQPAIDQKPNNAKTPEDRKAEFEKLIKGDYKDLFTEATQGIIDRRFKDTKTLEKIVNESKPVLDVLMNKYGITSGSIADLQKAIENDDAYWEELADKEGLTVEQFKEKQKLMLDNRRLREINQNADAQLKSKQIYDGWLAEEDALKQSGKYPNFVSLQEECKNPKFVDLISRGIGLEAAYEVTHLDDIKSNVAKKAESNVAETIRANGNRPAENGTSSQSGVVYKSDVSALTKEDRAEIARRAARGEPIKF